MPDRGRLLLPGAHDVTDRMLELSKRVVPSLRCDLDVAYGSDFFQKLDIYLPISTVPESPCPVLLFLHGGAWRHGFKEWEGFIAPQITDLPAVFVSGNYRLAPESKWPAQLHDVADAVTWIYKNIRRYGGDPRRLFLSGHSAGGHLVTMLALRPALLAERGIAEPIVRACCPMSAVFDVRLDRDPPSATREKVTLNLLSSREDDLDASPVTHTKGNQVPFYISYGAQDTDDIKADAALMELLLRKNSGIVDVDVFPGLTHFGTNEACKDREFAWIQKVRSWMRRAPDIATVSNASGGAQ